jgi:hypothetical protein
VDTCNDIKEVNNKIKVLDQMSLCEFDCGYGLKIFVMIRFGLSFEACFLPCFLQILDTKLAFDSLAPPLVASLSNNSNVGTIPKSILVETIFVVVNLMNRLV